MTLVKITNALMLLVIVTASPAHSYMTKFLQVDLTEPESFLPIEERRGLTIVNCGNLCRYNMFDN